MKIFRSNPTPSSSNFPHINILDLSRPLWIQKWLSNLGLQPCLVNLCRLFSGIKPDVNVCLWAADFKRCWQKTITERVPIKVHCPLKEKKKPTMDESSVRVLCFCSGPLLLQQPLAVRQRWGQMGLWLVAIRLCAPCLFVLRFKKWKRNQSSGFAAINITKKLLRFYFTCYCSKTNERSSLTWTCINNYRVD